MSQKLPVDGFEWRKDLFRSDEEFIQNYDENSCKGYILDVVVDYPKELQKEHSDLPFLLEKMKIDNCETVVRNLHGKKNYVININALKQVLDHELI